MKIGEHYRVFGERVRDADEYQLDDNRSLKNLVVSHTRLYKRKATRGHSHDGLEEVYIFTNGQGTIQIDKDLIPVQAGDLVAIPAGAFHRVVSSTTNELEFIAIFQSYERVDTKA